MKNNSNSDVVGFLRTDGKKLRNAENREVLLRGVGFGSWLLPEGYMWLFPERGDRPRRIERMIENLIGAEKAEAFWKVYYDRYISEADIRQIAAEGFNSVRIPINSRFLIKEDEPLQYKERHVKIIDQLIDWCRIYRLYVILDLHGAPGGQTGTNIDDSEHDQPELFMTDVNKQITVDLWRMLAKRYKDESIVAGYDLLNEPLPNWFSKYNHEVMPLYREIIRAIREVDDRHMIILEGAHWATDWSIFDEKPDDNIMLQFHKYWNNPDTESIQAYLDKQKEWNVPIYMGEGGENNKDWYTGAFQLFEDHLISWNFWTWKKMNTDNSPCSILMPAGWNLLIDYLNGGTTPNPEAAEHILSEYLDNLVFDRCIYHTDVVNSLFRRLPVRISTIFYGYKGEGLSYGVNLKTNTDLDFRMNDGTDIRFIKSSLTKPNFQHMKGEPWKLEEILCVRMTNGEWMAYEFTVADKLDSCNVIISASALTAGSYLSVYVDDVKYGSVEIDGESWNTYNLQEKIRLNPGKHKLVVKAKNSPVDVQWIEVTH